MEGGERPDVVVVLVTYHSAAVLPGLLDSLPGACRGLRWVLAVADNASTDRSLEIVRERCPDAVVVEMGGNRGYAAGINAAVAAAPPSDAVLVVNPDTRPSEGSVRHLLAALAEPGVGVVGPRLEDGTGALLWSMRRDPTWSRALSDALLGGLRVRRWVGETVNRAEDYGSERPADWLSGAFLAIARPCHDQLRGWDPRYFLYSEETDFAIRARRAGWAVRYVPGARVEHLGGESGVSPRLYSMLTLNRVRLVVRTRGRPYALVYGAIVLLGEVLRCARRADGAVHRHAVATLVFPWRRPVEVRRAS